MKKKQSKVCRTDILRSNLTAHKADCLIDILESYRQGSLVISRDQWKLFFQTGEFDKNNSSSKDIYKEIIGNSARVQMAQRQVVGQLKSWISNRAIAQTSIEIVLRIVI